jgi:hypothetical protein
LRRVQRTAAQDREAPHLYCQIRRKIPSYFN